MSRLWLQLTCIMLAFGLSVDASPLLAQTNSPQESAAPRTPDEMELLTTVNDLVTQLATPEIAERDEAEKKLLAIGTPALKFLKVSDEFSTDTNDRILRVRQQLEKIAAQQRLKPTSVTLKGELTAQQVLEQIGKQTENKIRLMEGVEGTEFDRAATYDLQSGGFWQAVKLLCDNNNLRIDAYQSEDSFLTLAPIANEKPVKIEIPSDNRSIFNVEVLRVDASRNMENPELDYCRLKCRVRWEPRIKPTVLDIPLSSVVIVDEFDDRIPLKNPEGVISCAVQSGIPEVEFSLPISLIDRQVENLKKVELNIAAVIPGRKEVFRFDDLTEIKAGAVIRKAGATFTYDGTEQLGDIYAVTMQLAFDEGSKAMESHQGWIYDNPLVLVDAAGQKIDNIGMETVSRTERSVGIKYFFSENPLEYGLEYKSAASIIKLPVSVVLKNIPLP